MAWRASERLTDVSRDGGGDEDAAAVRVLPEDEPSAAARSRLVFRGLARAPAGGGPQTLDVSRVAEAMDECGLDGGTCSRRYAGSRWAGTGGAVARLDAARFQTVVERFAGPARMQRRLRRRVDERAAGRGSAAEPADWDDVLDGLADLAV